MVDFLGFVKANREYSEKVKVLGVLLVTKRFSVLAGVLAGELMSYLD